MIFFSVNASFWERFPEKCRQDFIQMPGIAKRIPFSEILVMRDVGWLSLCYRTLLAVPRILKCKCLGLHLVTELTWQNLLTLLMWFLSLAAWRWLSKLRVGHLLTRGKSCPWKTSKIHKPDKNNVRIPLDKKRSFNPVQIPHSPRSNDRGTSSRSRF